MERRQLTRDEREVILDALLEAEVADLDTCRDAVANCVLIRRVPTLLEVRGPASAVAYLALRFRASGVTIGDDVYLRAEYFDTYRQIPLDLVAHEVAHVAQFRRDGTVPFLTRYLYHYARGLARGMSDRRAYRAIVYEREARRTAAALSDHPSCRVSSPEPGERHSASAR
jgi:hypothetical protein